MADKLLDVQTYAAMEGVKLAKGGRVDNKRLTKLRDRYLDMIPLDDEHELATMVGGLISQSVNDGYLVGKGKKVDFTIAMNRVTEIKAYVREELA